MSPIVSPTPPGQRIELLDALRGFAIFGILMVNMPLFFSPVTTMLSGYTGSENTLDLASQLIIKFFFEGKFYVLFSMLFGYGFWMFINRTNNNGRSIIPTFRLRLLFLLIFGIAHIVLLWAGDVLLGYALMGFILLLFRRVSDRGLIRWAITLALIPSFFMALMWLFAFLASLHPESKEAWDVAIRENAVNMQAIIDNAARVYSEGSFTEIVITRVNEYLTMLPGFLFFYPVVLAMFITGTLAARKGIISNFREHLPLFRKMLAWGLITGVILNALYAYAYTQAPLNEPGMWGFLVNFCHTTGGVAFSLAYVSFIALLSAEGNLKGFRNALAPVGRMALTNYLLHSIVCTTIFLPYGLGLFGKISISQGILLTIAIFLIQIPFSKLWLKHFYFGPFEWLWRSLTYRKWQPFVRK